MSQEARAVIVGGGVLGERRWAKVLGERRWAKVLGQGAGPSSLRPGERKAAHVTKRNAAE